MTVKKMRWLKKALVRPHDEMKERVDAIDRDNKYDEEEEKIRKVVFCKAWPSPDTSPGNAETTNRLPNTVWFTIRQSVLQRRPQYMYLATVTTFMLMIEHGVLHNMDEREPLESRRI